MAAAAAAGSAAADSASDLTPLPCNYLRRLLDNIVLILKSPPADQDLSRSKDPAFTLPSERRLVSESGGLVLRLTYNPVPEELRRPSPIPLHFPIPGRWWITARPPAETHEFFIREALKANATNLRCLVACVHVCTGVWLERLSPNVEKLSSERRAPVTPPWSYRNDINRRIRFRARGFRRVPVAERVARQRKSRSDERVRCTRVLGRSSRP
jgi:hypothetical protein